MVPFTGSYRPLWLGLGAVAFDLMLAVVITSLLRARIGYRAWRAVHWLAYASWPLALVHGLGTGSDVKSSWLLVLSAVCALVVLAAVLSRVLSACPPGPPARGRRSAGTAAFAIFLLAVAAGRAARLRMGAARGHPQLAARPQHQQHEPSTGSTQMSASSASTAELHACAAPRRPAGGAAAPARRHPRARAR